MEFACLDIMGKYLGLPVYDLLGGKLRDEVGFASYLFFRLPLVRPEGFLQRLLPLVGWLARPWALVLLAALSLLGLFPGSRINARTTEVDVSTGRSRSSGGWSRRRME